MDCLVAAASKSTFKLISWRIKDGCLVDDESALQVPPARLGVLGNLGPDLILLGRTGKSNIFITIEFAAVFGGCEHSAESGDAES